MNKYLFLDSDNQSKTQDFTIRFIPPYDLGDEQHELALKNLNLWYSWYNISTAKGNNQVRYFNSTQYETVKFPDGQYTIEDINNYLHDIMKLNGDYSVDSNGLDIFNINITPNYTTLRVNIAITNASGYKLDLTVSDIHLLLGWADIEIDENNDGDGQNVANINDSINSLIVHCDIVDSSKTLQNNTKSNIIHTFVPQAERGTNINVEPVNLFYLPIDTQFNVIKQIRMRITDNLGREIDLNNEPVSYTLALRPVKSNNDIKELMEDFINKLSENLSISNI